MHLTLSPTVVYIGKGGYWEGKAGGKLGWFPALAIREVNEVEETDTPDCEYIGVWLAYGLR